MPPLPLPPLLLTRLLPRLGVLFGVTVLLGFLGFLAAAAGLPLLPDNHDPIPDKPGIIFVKDPKNFVKKPNPVTNDPTAITTENIAPPKPANTLVIIEP